MQLVLDTNGLVVKKRNESFYIISKKIRRMISPYRVDSILVTADCLLSTAAIKLAVKHDIPIIFVSPSGNPQARMWKAYGGKEASLRRKQYAFSESIETTNTVVTWFSLKSESQIALLKKQLLLANLEEKENSKIEASIKKIEDLSLKLHSYEGADLTKVRPSILGTEGSMARHYWQALSATMPKEWQFKKRSRRPAEDAFNAMLNYAYGMLYNLVKSAILGAGLDPQLGVFHKDEWNKPTLSFDLIEPFRPWVDELLATYTLTHKVQSSYFVAKQGGMWLSKSGRALVIPLFNAYFAESIVWKDHSTSRKNHIYRFVGLYAQKFKHKSENQNN